MAIMIPYFHIMLPKKALVRTPPPWETKITEHQKKAEGNPFLKLSESPLEKPRQGAAAEVAPGRVREGEPGRSTWIFGKGSGETTTCRVRIQIYYCRARSGVNRRGLDRFWYLFVSLRRLVVYSYGAR